MISQFKRGMRHDMSVGQFRVELVQRQVKAMEFEARVTARRICRVVKAQLEAKIVDWTMARDARLLTGLARQYGVHKVLIPYTVSFARTLIEKGI